MLKKEYTGGMLLSFLGVLSIEYAVASNKYF